MAEIIVGATAEDRNGTQNSRTIVNVGAVATGTGKITSVEIWANADLTNVEVATFSAVGNVLTTRDHEAIPGTITAGSKVTKTVDLDVVAGDHIGIKFTGTMEVTTGSGSGTWNSGFGTDKIPCIDEDFGSPWANTTLSLKGIGETAGDFEYSGSGSLAFSGTATTIYSKDYLTTGSGTLAFSGSAVIVFSLAFSGSGTLTYSGTATAYVDTRHYLYTTSGSLAFSGAGTCSLGFSYTGSGTLTYSGSATQSHGYNFNTTASGTLNFGGEAVYGEAGWFYAGWFEHGWFYGIGVTTDFVYSGTGSLTYSGTAVQSYTFNYSCVASGILTFSSTGTCSLGFSRVGSGSLAFSGAGTYSLGFSYTGSGSFICSGSAVYSYEIEEVNFTYVATGTLIFSGVATHSYTRIFSYSGSGEFLYSGSAVVEISNFISTGSGIFIYSGEAENHYCYSYTKVYKDVSIYIKIDKDTSIYTKVDKDISNYDKIERGC